jgi:hypothetical protein
MFRADLHCHCKCSDGTLNPTQLIEEAKRIGLSGLSITDHDTLQAYAEAIPKAKELGICLGAGIELSCTLREKSIHILGYDYDLSSKEIHSFCERHILRRKERNLKILEKLRRLNMPIKESELKALSTIGRPHIAQIMVEKGYVNSIKEAFSSFIGEGKCCYDSGEPVSVEETIEVIHFAKGKAFIAHPHLISHRFLLKELLKMPFDGIECFYANFLPSEHKKWLQIAEEKKWLISGGSDFHGDVKPGLSLGCSWVDEKTFFSIFSKSLT